MVKNGLWGLLLFLAIAVAGYALALLVIADIRTDFVQHILSLFPYVSSIHFIGGAIAIVVGALQFSTRIRNRFIVLHRYMGKTYVVAILFSGIAGFILAINSVAGPFAQMGFALMALTWLITTGYGYVAVRRKQISGHKQWMMRSYAVTVAGVTLRLYLGIGFAAGLSFSEFYPYLAWLCWVPNLVVMEVYLRVSSGKNVSSPVRTVERTMSFESR